MVEYILNNLLPTVLIAMNNLYNGAKTSIFDWICLAISFITMIVDLIHLKRTVRNLSAYKLFVKPNEI